MRARTALETVPCVRKAEVDFSKKEAYVTADKKTLDTQAMIKALANVGYQGSVKIEPH